MIIGNEISLAAYNKMINTNKANKQTEDAQSNKGLLARTTNSKSSKSSEASPAERAARYLAEINRIRTSMKENM